MSCEEMHGYKQMERITKSALWIFKHKHEGGLLLFIHLTHTHGHISAGINWASVLVWRWADDTIDKSEFMVRVLIHSFFLSWW